MFAQQGCEATESLTGREDLITELPILVLNIHSRCNCRCVMCDIWRREESAEIRVATLQRHRESLRRLSVRWVVFSGGEPLLHSDLGALCTFFRELDIRITLLTTGLLLSKRVTEISELFDDIIVSVDGPADVHDAIRRVKGAFHLIETGVATVRQLRPAMRITGRTTVQKSNFLHLRDTVASAKAIALDSISFLAADLTSEAFNRPLLWPTERQNEIGLTLNEVCALRDEIEELITDYSEEVRTEYIAESAGKLRKIADHFSAQLGIGKHQSPRCNAPWVSAVIETDGSVRPCFFHRAIGNLRDSTLENIVNGEEGRSFRRTLQVDENPTCQRCVCSLHYSGPEKGAQWTKS
jgi:MoaA/NifB/PqqE/SkfB family radical SAM enzyme